MSHFKTLIFVMVWSFGALAVAPPAPTKEGDTPRPEAPVAAPVTSPATALTPSQLAEQEALKEQQRLAEEQQQAQDQQQIQQLMQMLGGGMSGGAGGSGLGTSGLFGPEVNSAINGGGGASGYISTRPPSQCGKVSALSEKMLADYKACAASKSSALGGKRPILINTDEKIGYMLDVNGNMVNCFTVTIGSRGVAPAGTTASGSKMTEIGFFYTQPHAGAKYTTNTNNFERKGIGMGIPGGKIFHSDHERNATWGCIGIEMSKWKQFCADNVWNSPSFVWSERYSGPNRICHGGRAAGSPNAPSGGTPASAR